jgi:DNA-binding NarL/FixJ family response regulator
VKPIRVVLADDHTLVRAGMRTLLQSLPGIEVVAEAQNGRDVLRLIEQHRPDVVMMDISMPELNGLEATARVARDWPGVRVIILSMHATEEYVCQALRAGAAGYLLKDADTAELELAVKSIARGESYLSPAVSRHVIGDYIRRTGSESNTLELLTPRQREVLQLVAEGNSTKEIARKLHVSVKTVETHRLQLMERLDIHDIASLVRYALRVGLIKPDI